jgi:serine/threonine protein kinase
MAMPYYDGPTLTQALASLGRPPDEPELMRWLGPLLDALADLHAGGCLHRDVAPDNILLTDRGPVLLDFGAARQTLALDQPMLKPMYTPGFASPEQFANREALGPWSDIYSVGASMYACIVGTAPPRSDDRVKQDTLQPIARQHASRYSPQLLELVDWCLRLDPLARPQSVYTLQKALMQKEAGEAMPASWFTDLGSRLKSFIGKR